MCITFSFSIHFSTDRDWFNILKIVNSAAMNLGMRVSLQDTDSISFGNILRSRIAGSYESLIFNSLRNLHTVFYGSCPNLHSHQQCTKVPISPHPYQHVAFIFSVVAILTGVKWYPMMALIGNSLVITDAEHLPIYLLAICMTSLEKCLFKSFARF